MCIRQYVQHLSLCVLILIAQMGCDAQQHRIDISNATFSGEPAQASEFGFFVSRNTDWGNETSLTINLADKNKIASRPKMFLAGSSFVALYAETTDSLTNLNVRMSVIRPSPSNLVKHFDAAKISVNSSGNKNVAVAAAFNSSGRGVVLVRGSEGNIQFFVVSIPQTDESLTNSNFDFSHPGTIQNRNGDSLLISGLITRLVVTESDVAYVLLSSNTTMRILPLNLSTERFANTRQHIVDIGANIYSADMRISPISPGRDNILLVWTDGSQSKEGFVFESRAQIHAVAFYADGRTGKVYPIGTSVRREFGLQPFGAEKAILAFTKGNPDVQSEPLNSQSLRYVVIGYAGVELDLQPKEPEVGAQFRGLFADENGENVKLLGMKTNDTPAVYAISTSDASSEKQSIDISAVTINSYNGDSLAIGSDLACSSTIGNSACTLTVKDFVEPAPNETQWKARSSHDVCSFSVRKSGVRDLDFALNRAIDPTSTEIDKGVGVVMYSWTDFNNKNNLAIRTLNADQ